MSKRICPNCAGKMGKTHEFCPHCGKRPVRLVKSETPGTLGFTQSNVMFDLSSPDPNEREQAWAAKANQIRREALADLDPLSEADPNRREAIWQAKNRTTVEKVSGGNW